MEIMTSIGPINRKSLVESLQTHVDRVDPGIRLHMIRTDWGMTIVPKRQDRSLPWRITMNTKGQCVLYKPVTASIPTIDISLDEGQHELLCNYFISFIERGWI